MILNASILLALIGTLTAATVPPPAHLEKRGSATQLIVDGKPFLVLAGELTNTAASSPEHMKTVWPHLVKVGLNTVLAPMAWAWIEPQEGKFDFTLADNVIRDARANHMRIAWLWFASWKNGLTNFAPVWVVANQDRFPRAQLAGGQHRRGAVHLERRQPRRRCQSLRGLHAAYQGKAIRPPAPPSWSNWRMKLA